MLVVSRQGDSLHWVDRGLSCGDGDPGTKVNLEEKRTGVVVVVYTLHVGIPD